MQYRIERKGVYVSILGIGLLNNGSLASVFVSLWVSHYTAECYTSCYSNGVVLQLQTTEVVEYVLSCSECPCRVVLMLSMGEAKDTEKCTTLEGQT